MINYIPHSLIHEYKPGANCLIIDTFEGEYTTKDHFTSDANGITGKFIKCK